jgi:hypothetical protein
MRILTFIFILLHLSLLGQGDVGVLFEEMPNDSVFSNSIQLHTSVLPQIRLKNALQDKRDAKRKLFSVVGLGDLGYRYSTESEYRAGLGISIESSINDKWHIRINGIQGMSNSDSIFSPKSFVTNKQTTYSLYTDIRGRVSYTPNDVFNFQIGLDHNFIGEGNRSLFLSDYGKPYPYGQIRARFWRVEYSVLYQFYQEKAGENWRLKNGATHHISFNAAKWLNFGIFETVIFQPKDTLLNRGYDVEYLNPVIFYRPQEYSLGSSDNVLLGASVTAKWKKHILYGQLILDEFFLSEIKAKSGWWANKYGGQIGIKGRFKRGHTNFFYRTEYNFVRPYTYSHLNSGQNYGNQGMTLAHPYGGNFMELLGELKIQREKWSLKTFVSYSLRGYDKDGYSYGSNLYQPYTNRPFDYGHFIGEGQGNNAMRIIITISYHVLKAGNLQAFFENQLRYDSAFNRTMYIPMIGLRSQLWNDYRNY